MEKGTAHYKLARVRDLLQAGRLRLTRSAFVGASSMGLNEAAVRELLLRLDSRDFYKSMTTYEDHRLWQDVYRPVTRHGALYLKLIVVDDVLVVSFKFR
ncbi:type II toxin-antitoxin system MqsR family toxin [Cupriavidus sp. L7L]|uniref:type II toxin-antitoxin system MqsR family toxin n=1 Tax=Cupriavidus sp. L7L TaxID=2546443 RepID=UPI0010555422|nr:type II toxin-antitoxin system MqsR family toxin [Cupriavidus sp. L7L]TDF60184.1 type II toxin-antitoxin system MqsR family toxin [Cupriavidus sp. L7L]